MKASRILIDALKRFEGFRASAYRCPAGVWTIGYGHTSGVKRGDKISEAEADRLLRRDLIACEAYVEQLNVTCKQEKFDALVDFCFNMAVKHWSTPHCSVKYAIALRTQRSVRSLCGGCMPPWPAKARAVRIGETETVGGGQVL